MAQAAARAMSYSADGSDAIAQYIAVTLTGTDDRIAEVGTADIHILGVLQNNVLANSEIQSVTVVDEGPTKMVAGGALTAGDPIAVSSAGKAVEAKGSVSIDCGANTKLTFTETDAGRGKIKSIAYENPGFASNTGYVENNGGAVRFMLNTGGGGAIDETGDSLKALLAAHTELNALLTATDFAGNDGSGTLTAHAAVPLVGAANIIGYTREDASGTGSEIDVILYGKAV